MKIYFYTFLISLASGSFQQWTITDQLPTSYNGQDCDTILPELTELICGKFEQCRMENCTVGRDRQNYFFNSHGPQDVILTAWYFIIFKIIYSHLVELIKKGILRNVSTNLSKKKFDKLRPL